MDYEEEIPFFTRYASLVPTTKSLAPECKEDELSSSDKVVNKGFNKKEFVLGFQVSITEAMSTAMSVAMSQVISKLLEQPVKTRGNKKCRKSLHDRDAKHLTDNTGTGSIIMQSRAASQHSGNMENVICNLMRSDSEASE